MANKFKIYSYLKFTLMLSNFPIKKLEDEYIPSELFEIAEPPRKIFIRGTIPDPSFIRLAVVGSRKYTPYGKEACKKLILGLRGYNIVIVSGLALGIDSIAHEAALEAGLPTMAIPGSGLSQSVLYPHSHANLAKRILEKGGCLLSEYEQDQEAAPWTFPQRNRIMAGISKAVLVIEAEKKSGTMITARLATEYNRDVLAVPGSIFSKTSEGTHLLMKLGATPISSSEDILEALGIIEEEKVKQEKLFDDCNQEELDILKILDSPKTKEEICETLNISTQKINSTLTMLEIKGLVKESVGKIYLV